MAVTEDSMTYKEYFQLLHGITEPYRIIVVESDSARINQDDI